jgi:alpha-glucosidase
MSFDPASKQVILDKADGNYVSHFSKIKIVLHGFEQVQNQVTVNGSAKTVAFEEVSFISALSKFDPLGMKGSLSNAKLPVLLLPNTRDKTIISW